MKRHYTKNYSDSIVQGNSVFLSENQKEPQVTA